jgi:hypothetical protein
VLVALPIEALEAGTVVGETLVEIATRCWIGFFLWPPFLLLNELALLEVGRLLAVLYLRLLLVSRILQRMQLLLLN